MSKLWKMQIELRIRFSTQVPEKNKIITKISNVEIPESENNNEPKFKDALEYNAPSKSNMEVNIGNMIVEQQLFVEFKIY